MSPETIFRTQLLFGYVAWLLCFSLYILPRLRAMERIEAHRAILTLHSFRFFGLAMILPGFVGAGLPASFAFFAAWVDLATAVLAVGALLTVRVRPLFWLFTAACHLVGITDLILDYYHAIMAGIPANPGVLGVAYIIPVLYVPILMITHVVALSWMVRPQPRAIRVLAGSPAANLS